MRKIYIKPLAEFEEIEGLNDLMQDKLSRFETEGSGTTDDNTPTELPWGGDTPGGEGGEDDPNG